MRAAAECQPALPRAHWRAVARTMFALRVNTIRRARRFRRQGGPEQAVRRARRPEERQRAAGACVRRRGVPLRARAGGAYPTAARATPPAPPCQLQRAVMRLAGACGVLLHCARETTNRRNARGSSSRECPTHGNRNRARAGLRYEPHDQRPVRVVHVHSTHRRSRRPRCRHASLDGARAAHRRAPHGGLRCLPSLPALRPAATLPTPQRAQQRLRLRPPPAHLQTCTRSG